MRALIRRLRKQIPKMKCKPGCHDCCGPIPFCKWEWERVPQIKAEGETCPYVVNLKCSIYRERPILCRLFGATLEERLKCPHGYAPAKPLSVKETRRLMNEYLNLFGEGSHDPRRD